MLLVHKTKTELLKDKYYSFCPDVIAETMPGCAIVGIEMSYGTIRRQLKNKYGAGVAELAELDAVIMKQHAEAVNWWNE